MGGGGRRHCGAHSFARTRRTDKVDTNNNAPIVSHEMVKEYNFSDLAYSYFHYELTRSVLGGGRAAGWHHRPSACVLSLAIVTPVALSLSSGMGAALYLSQRGEVSSSHRLFAVGFARLARFANRGRLSQASPAARAVHSWGRLVQRHLRRRRYGALAGPSHLAEIRHDHACSTAVECGAFVFNQTFCRIGPAAATRT